MNKEYEEVAQPEVSSPEPVTAGKAEAVIDESSRINLRDKSDSKAEISVVAEVPKPQLARKSIQPCPPFKLHIFKAGDCLIIDTLGMEYDVQAELLLRRFHVNLALPLSGEMAEKAEVFNWPQSDHPYAPRDKETATNTLCNKIRDIDPDSNVTTLVLCGNQAQDLLISQSDMKVQYSVITADRLSSLLHSGHKKKEFWGKLRREYKSKG